MHFHSRVRRSVVQNLDRDESAAVVSSGTRAEVAASVRAAENVAQWRKYLPEDCIQTMVAAGWDRTV